MTVRMFFIYSVIHVYCLLIYSIACLLLISFLCHCILYITILFKMENIELESKAIRALVMELRIMEALLAPQSCMILEDKMHRTSGQKT